MARGSPLVEDAANQAAYGALLDALRAGALALVGAGSSARVGYPLWGGLLAALEATIREQQPRAADELRALADERDTLWRAERYRTLLGPDGYEPLMREMFGPRTPAFDGFHETLIRLPFRHILTTNYDPVLEHAHTAVLKEPPIVVVWTNRADMNELVRRIGDPTLGRRYVYLHGRYNDPATLVLTERDYTDRYTKEADTWPKLFALLSTQRVVSTGFSLEDLDLMGVFRSVKAHLGPGRPAHFAILAGSGERDLSVQRERLRVKFGVEPVFYRWSADHAALGELLEQLVQETNPPPPPRRAVSGVNTAPGDVEGPLPSLEVVLDGRSEGSREFVRLMHALLAVYAKKQEFAYETYSLVGLRPDPVYSDIAAIAPEGGVPDLDGPVAFELRFARGPEGGAPFDVRLHRPPNASLTSGIKHCVLITPAKITAEEQRALAASTHEAELHVWGMDRIEAMLRDCPALFARYYPRQAQALLPGYDGFHFGAFARSYREKVAGYHRRLTTIGLPPEALRQHDATPEIELPQVFVPLRLRPERDGERPRPLQELLNAGVSAVVLGDPGTGKSTLLKFLCLLLSGKASLEGFEPRPRALPLFVSLRDFVRLRKDRASQNLTVLDYLVDRAKSDLQLASAHRAFFEAALRMGEAVVLFDGLDEVGREVGRQQMSRVIEAFCQDYPGCAVWVTSRVYGYTRDVRLSSSRFQHFRIDRLELDQIDDFVGRWYAIQLQASPRERDERTASLRAAVRRTPGVQRLAGNPLLLTLMAFIHHGLKRLPQDRGELYEKCVEMLLKTWQEARRGEDEGTAPVRAARGPELHLHTQKDYLAHLALRVQERNYGGAGDDARGLVPRAEALDALAARHLESARRTRPDLTIEQAREEMAGFLDYISDETGLLIDRGDDQLSFIHLSFQEYLAAWVATCAPVQPSEQVDFFERHLAAPLWEEVLLLRLYIILRTPGGGGPTVFDAVVGALKRQLERTNAPEGWLTLARALRDHLDFTPSDVEAIVRRAIDLWAEAPALRGAWFTALEEIALFGGAGKAVLLERLREAFRRDAPARAIACLHLGERLFGFPDDAPAVFEARMDLPALLPDLVAFADVPAVAELLSRRASLAGWVDALHALEGPDIYELSVALATTSHPAGASGEALRAGIAWLAGKIAAELASRSAFATRHASSDANDLFKRPGTVVLRGALHEVKLPLAGARAPSAPFRLTVAAPHGAQVRARPFELTAQRLKAHRPGSAVEHAAVQSARTIIHTALELFMMKNSISDGASDELVISFREFSREFGREFGREFKRGFKGEFSDLYGRDFGRDFVHYFGRDFGRDFVCEFGGLFGRDFGRYFVHDFSRLFCRRFGRNFPRDFGIDPDSPDAATDWKELLSSQEGVARILAHPQFWTYLAWSSIEIEVKNSRGPATIVSKLENPLDLPALLVDQWAASSISHSFTASRHAAAFSSPTGKVDDGVWTAWLRRHPIAVYQTAFAWEEHARAFTLTHSRLAGPRGALLLAHAAYAVLMTGIECDAQVWQDLLEQRDRDDPLIGFAHLLYDIARFSPAETTTPALDALRASPRWSEVAPLLEAAGLSLPAPAA